MRTSLSGHKKLISVLTTLFGLATKSVETCETNDKARPAGQVIEVLGNFSMSKTMPLACLIK